MYCLHFFRRRQCSYFKRYLATRCQDDSTYSIEMEIKPSRAMCLRVLSSGACDSPRTLVLEVFGMRYLINCGESTERRLKESRFSISNMRCVLLTSLTWQNISGLQSLVLMAQNAARRQFMYVFGPKGVEVLMSASEAFLDISKITLKFLDVGELQNTRYPNLIIKPVIMRSRDKSPSAQALGPTWKKSGIHVNYYATDKKEFSSSIIDNSEIKVEKDVSIAYICCSSGYRKPHLDARKCMELGVSPGPCITQLQRGNDITLKDGTILKAEEVMGNKSWNSTVIVVECPTLSFLDSLLSAEAFKEFQDPHHRGGNTVVAHLTPLNVMKDPRYIQWMSSFPPDTYHLVVNENNLCNGHGTVLWRQNFMHLLNPQIFPLLRGVRAQNTEVPAKLGASKFAGKVLKEFADSCIVHDFQTEHSGGVEENKVTENTSVEWRARWGSEAAGLQLIEARTGTLFSFGCNPVQRNQEPWWNDSALHYIVNSVPVVKNVLDGVNDVYKKMGIYQETNPKETFPHVVFLGTSAASAIRYRNTSSILLNISQDKSILMDCGEGTILQLQALYEEAELQKVLCSIRAIYISHLHADHHLGLSSVLQARKKALAAAGNVSQPLLLLAPHTITDWLSLIHYHFTDVLNNVTFVPLKDIDVGRHLPSTKHIDDLLLNQLEMQLVTTCKVDHCIFAYGVTFCHKDGWKITYSGDTMYCDALAKMGTNSDLLIHEATFGNTLGFMARAKRHSTTDDAVLCGEVMQAKFTILTHFSQRYHFMPQIDELLEMNKSNVSISFDFMKVNLQDLPTLHLLHHAYLELFRKQQERVKRRLEKILMKVNKRR